MILRIMRSAAATAGVRRPLSSALGLRSWNSNATLYQPRAPRPYSTAPPNASAPAPPNTPSPWIRRSTLVFLLLGAALALPVYRQVAYFFPSFPDPGSSAEDAARSKLEARAAKLPVVVELITDPRWVEWDVGSRWREAGDEGKDDHQNHQPVPPRTRLTRNALGGVRGMTGYHRVFLQPSTGELVSVVHLGGALSGFPTRAHGGALATLLDEALGRCAMQTLPARTGVTARLELQYRRPVSVPEFYVVRCRPELPPGYDPANTAAPELRKIWCAAELTTVDGKTCVEARGLFVVPRGYKLGQMKSRF